MFRLSLWIMSAEILGLAFAFVIAHSEGAALAHILQPVINALPG